MWFQGGDMQSSGEVPDEILARGDLQAIQQLLPDWDPQAVIRIYQGALAMPEAPVYEPLPGYVPLGTPQLPAGWVEEGLRLGTVDPSIAAPEPEVGLPGFEEPGAGAVSIAGGLNAWSSLLPAELPVGEGLPPVWTRPVVGITESGWIPDEEGITMNGANPWATLASGAITGIVGGLAQALPGAAGRPGSLMGAQVVASGRGYLVLQTGTGRRITVQRRRRTFRRRGGGAGGLGMARIMQLAIMKSLLKG